MQPVRREAHRQWPARPRLRSCEAELAQLQLVDRRRRAGQRVGAGGGLREGDHVADRVGAGEPLDDPVEPVGDAAVRRGAVAERLEQEAEARLGLLGVDPERGEDLAAGRSASLMRIEPPPISWPFQTTS